MVKGAEIIQENLSQMKLALKESKKSTDGGRIIESRSNGTKYFTSFQHKSMGEGANQEYSHGSEFSLFNPKN